jgi:hypothetical protein
MSGRGHSRTYREDAFAQVRAADLQDEEHLRDRSERAAVCAGRGRVLAEVCREGVAAPDRFGVGHHIVLTRPPSIT